jgi:hypothetical protein
MDWFQLTIKYHSQTLAHECRLNSLPEEWQRELAALWRLDADVNNGAYVQFFVNWGRESYVYASQALKKMGALRLAEIVDQCQGIIDEHVQAEVVCPEELRDILPGKLIATSGEIIKDADSTLPQSAIDRIYELSYEYMDCCNDLDHLGMEYYAARLAYEG